MKYLSVCSGVEAATVAWHGLGWKPVAFSDIEKFTNEVLAHHYPNVPNMGDMTKYKEWNLNGSIDLLVGGTPCQSFSVAGLRKGLEDPRGNLMLTYVGILDKFRPKWCVWENVPGVLSSNGGRDFGSFLGALVELGYGFAYRVLDAQNFGVPQRRRRVFVVGCLGDWEYPAKVLFESESLRGDTKKSRSKKQNPTSFVESSFGAFREDELAGTLRASGGANAGGSETLYVPNTARCLTRGVAQKNDFETDTFITQVYENHGTDSRVKPVEICPTVTSRWGTGGNNVPLAQNIAYSIQGSMIGRSDTAGPQGAGVNEEISFTLNTTDRHGVAQVFQQNTRNEVRYIGGNGQIAGALMAEPGMKQQNYIHHNMAVRRLTPIECERLQGFPDDYTNIKDKCPDGPRYKAMGNSMAVPVMKWIGERIESVAK
jgi:DNA (cytosine-5)-methyltransferase 1